MQRQENISISVLTITYCCEAGKTYVDILENQIRNYQTNKKINDMKDVFPLRKMWVWAVCVRMHRAHVAHREGIV